MGESVYINTNLYNEKIVCDICNDPTKVELTRFIKHKDVCGRHKKNNLGNRLSRIFKNSDDDMDIRIHVCQSCVSRAFRKFNSKL